MWGSGNQNPYLARDYVCSSCCKTHDRRQLIKVGAVTQSYLWALSISIRDSVIKQLVTRGGQLTKVVLWASSSSGTVGPLIFLLPGLGLNTQLQRLSFPDSGNDNRISRTPLLLCYHGVSCDVRTPGNIIRPDSGLLN